MQDPLTPEERRVMRLFAEAFWEYSRLPELRPHDLQDALVHARAIETLIKARPANRYEQHPLRAPDEGPREETKWAPSYRS